jgi:cell division protein FtsL
MTAVTAPRARTGARAPAVRSGTQPAVRSGTQPVRRWGTQPVRAHRAARRVSGARAGIGVFVAAALVFAFVSAVLFHVVLAQGQLELDRLDAQITAERREYEQRRLAASTYASPPRIIEEALRQGLVIPPEPPTYLIVEGAPVPDANAGNPSTTLDDWEDVKPNLGDNPP